MVHAFFEMSDDAFSYTSTEFGWSAAFHFAVAASVSASSFKRRSVSARSSRALARAVSRDSRSCACMADQSAVNFGFLEMFDTVVRLKFLPPVVGNAILLASRSKLKVNERHLTSSREHLERQKRTNVCRNLNARRLKCETVNKLSAFLRDRQK